eukprot:GHRR01019470.1.p1 GENE.GHRR01019470.1~~GHRR01019470.1.p1  ORF type:complete len:427 (+),score=163.61 GHRR01019470.1:849-2129(+)
MTQQKVCLEDFNLTETIARGSFGIVYKVVRIADGRIFALKQVKLKGMKRVDRQEAIDEARVLSDLNHPHIIRHHGSLIDKDDQLNILMEYASSGSLHARIRAASGKTLPEAQVWKHISQALLGLSYLHSRHIIHRDIKSLNLFLDGNDNIKIGDLGIARSLSGESEVAHTIVGTPYYLSPELCDDKPYDVKSDVWALGVVLYECCMGRYPFEAQNEGALIRKILRGTFTPVSGPYSPALRQVVAAMLTMDPRRRPTADKVLQMPAVISQATSLGIDMSCKTPAPPDKPVYDNRAAGRVNNSQQQSQQQHQQQHASSTPKDNRDASRQLQHIGQQQHQQPHQQQERGRPQPAIAPAGLLEQPHPFDMPPAADAAAYLPAVQQQQQRQGPGSLYPGAAIDQLQQMARRGSGVPKQQVPQQQEGMYQSR